MIEGIKHLEQLQGMDLDSRLSESSGNLLLLFLLPRLSESTGISSSPYMTATRHHSLPHNSPFTIHFLTTHFLATRIASSNSIVPS